MPLGRLRASSNATSVLTYTIFCDMATKSLVRRSSIKFSLEANSSSHNSNTYHLNRMECLRVVWDLPMWLQQKTKASWVTYKTSIETLISGKWQQNHLWCRFSIKFSLEPNSSSHNSNTYQLNWMECLWVGWDLPVTQHRSWRTLISGKWQQNHLWGCRLSIKFSIEPNLSSQNSNAYQLKWMECLRVGYDLPVTQHWSWRVPTRNDNKHHIIQADCRGDFMSQLILGLGISLDVFLQVNVY